MECKLILIDFDGTIVDSKKFHKKGLIESLNKNNIKFNKKQIPRFLGEKTITILRQLKINKNKTKLIIEGINQEKIEHLNDIKLTKPPLFFEKLSKKKPTIIISNAEGDFIKKSLRNLKINKYFKNILGAENFKDKADGIKKMFKKYKIKPKQAVYIGDRYSDVIYGKRAGVKTIAISNKYSWSTKKELKNQNPDYLIKDLSDLNKIIR